MLSDQNILEQRKKRNKFTKLDFKEGVIDQNRLDEISHDLKIKIEVLKNFTGSELAIKEASKIIAALHTVDSFHRNELHDNYTHELEPDALKNFNELHFFIKLKRFNHEILQLEAVALFLQSENEKEQLLQKLEYLQKDQELKLIEDNNYQVQTSNLLKERQLKLEQLIARNEAYILELGLYQNHLRTVIDRHESILRSHRKHYTQRILHYAGTIEINGKKIFDGVPEENKIKFIEDLMSLSELKVRDVAKIEHKYQSMIDALDGTQHKDKDQKSILHSFAESHLETKKAEFIKERDTKIAEKDVIFRDQIKQSAAIRGVHEIKTLSDVDLLLEHKELKSDLAEYEIGAEKVVRSELVCIDDAEKNDRRIEEAKENNHKLKEEKEVIKEDKQITKEDRQVIKEDKQVIKEDKQVIKEDKQVIKEDKQVIREQSRNHIEEYFQKNDEAYKSSSMVEILEEQPSNIVAIEQSVADSIPDSDDFSIDDCDMASLDDDMPDLSKLSLDNYVSTSLLGIPEVQNHSTVSKK